MKISSKILFIGALVGSVLTACSGENEKATTTSDNHQTEVKAEAAKTENKKAKTMKKKSSSAILTYGEMYKGKSFSITADSAQFYKPNPDFDKFESKDSRFVLAVVTVKNATKTPITPIGLTFTLTNDKTGETYDWSGEINGGGSNVSAWGSEFDDTLQVNDWVMAELPFELPQGSDKDTFTLHVSYDGDNENNPEELGKWKLDNIKTSKF